jgi:hypothetical protein
MTRAKVAPDELAVSDLELEAYKYSFGLLQNLVRTILDYGCSSPKRSFLA